MNKNKFEIDEKKVEQLKQKMEDRKLTPCIKTLDNFIEYSNERYSEIEKQLINPNLTEEDRNSLIRKLIVAERKFRHMIDVPNLCINYSTEKKFEKDQSIVLTTVGVLHDIGRIDEIIGQGSKTVFKNKVDHAEIGANYLSSGESICGNDHIYDFVSEELVRKYGELIKKLVRYHGLFKIPFEKFPTEMEKSLIHDIRLIDKSSIMNSFLKEDISTVIGITEEELGKSHISDTTYQELTTDGLLDRRKAGEEYTPNRHFMSHISFIYDMDDYSLLEKEWVKKYLDIYQPIEIIDQERKQEIEKKTVQHIKIKK